MIKMKYTRRYWQIFIGLFLLLLMSKVGQTQNNYSVYVFVAEKCPISIYMAKPLQAAYQQFGDEVDFSVVFPMKNSTQQSAQKFLDEYDLKDFNIKLDNYQGFAKKLGATITPEVVVLDDSGAIVYRGRISDAYRAPGKMKHGSRKNEMINVLQTLTSGASVPEPWDDAVGCYITFH